MLSRNASLLAASVALAASTPIAHAESNHDVHYLSEHVPESGMDAHYQALPWPAAPLEPKRWEQSVDFSTAHTTTDFIDLDGPMIAFAAARGVTRKWGYELLGFYSTMDISGDSDRLDLTGAYLDVPLDLPQPADFTNPRGTFEHYGVGAAYARNLPHGSQLIAGLLLEGIDGSGYRMDYTIAAGADAGVSGVLDHSHSASFLTPFVGWQQTRSLGARWSWSPRAQLTFPLPPGDLDTRLTGPGFDLATPQDGRPIDIGDPYFAAGLAFEHLPSGIEVDLGSTLFFPLAEHVSHPGVDRAIVLHVAWKRHTAAQPY